MSELVTDRLRVSRVRTIVILVEASETNIALALFTIPASARAETRLVLPEFDSAVRSAGIAGVDEPVNAQPALVLAQYLHGRDRIRSAVLDIDLPDSRVRSFLV